jgi:hypothetical protein
MGNSLTGGNYEAGFIELADASYIIETSNQMSDTNSANRWGVGINGGSYDTISYDTIDSGGDIYIGSSGNQPYPNSHNIIKGNVVRLASGANPLRGMVWIQCNFTNCVADDNTIINNVFYGNGTDTPSGVALEADGSSTVESTTIEGNYFYGVTREMEQAGKVENTVNTGNFYSQTTN